jgi:hypothetical protein
MINNHVALKTISLLKMTHLDQLTLLLKSLLPITKDFLNKNHIKPYNIILAASDTYYRENYHSDIIILTLHTARMPDDLEFHKKNCFFY